MTKRTPKLVMRNRTSSVSTELLFYSQLKSKVPRKATALHINLNIHDASIVSLAHTHPSHSQTSSLLFTSLSLGIPFPRSS
jgi:hypothetical protein